MEQRSTKLQRENSGDKIRRGRMIKNPSILHLVYWISSLFTPKSISWFGVVLISLGLLLGCERPDPNFSDNQMPAETATPLPSPTALPTQSTVQVYVVVVTATPNPSQPAKSYRPVSVAVNKQKVALASTKSLAKPIEPTPLPPDYLQGWAWSESLKDDRGQVKVGVSGLTLRDRPSQDGRIVGVVFGLVYVSVVGRDQCGYTPILVHEDDMITKTTPNPEILPPEPLPTEPPLFTPIPVPTARFTNGWAYTDELTLLGQTAISGPLGINLRSDPCLAATNLGFIPAGTDMIVSGPPGVEYTAVQVSNDLLQPPFDIAELSSPNGNEMVASRLEHLLPVASPIPENVLDPPANAILSASSTPVMMSTPLMP